MLKKVFKALDTWIEAQNEEREQEGMLKLGICEIRVLGQTALIEANLSIHVPATMDVDVFAKCEHSVRRKFEDLLKEIGKELDPVGHEAWMPKETEYDDFFTGKWVNAYLAAPEYILISKAKKAPTKNRALLVEYIASGPPKKFFALANKYEIDLGSFLE